MAKQLTILESVFGGPGRIAVLRVLAGQGAPLTGRQVAALAGLSERGAALSLAHLAALGIVTQRHVGRAITQELNRDSALVGSIILPALAAESGLQGELVRALSDAFDALSVSVVLFGSVARGEAGPGSDIDVLVVTGDDETAVLALSAADRVSHEFYRRFAMPLSVIVTTAAALPSQPSHFLAAARDEGVLVSGTPLADLMGAHASR